MKTFVAIFFGLALSLSAQTPAPTRTPIPPITPTPPSVPPMASPTPKPSIPPLVAGATVVFSNKLQVNAFFTIQTSRDQNTWTNIVSVPFTTTPPVQFYRAIVTFTPEPSSPTPAPSVPPRTSPPPSN